MAPSLGVPISNHLPWLGPEIENWWLTNHNTATLWWTNIAMKNHHFQWENPLFLWPFSIAMLVHQRVFFHSSQSPTASSGFISVVLLDVVGDIPTLLLLYQEPSSSATPNVGFVNPLFLLRVSNFRSLFPRDIQDIPLIPTKFQQPKHRIFIGFPSEFYMIMGSS